MNQGSGPLAEREGSSRLCQRDQGLVVVREQGEEPEVAVRVLRFFSIFWVVRHRFPLWAEGVKCLSAG